MKGKIKKVFLVRKCIFLKNHKLLSLLARSSTCKSILLLAFSNHYKAFSCPSLNASQVFQVLIQSHNLFFFQWQYIIWQILAVKESLKKACSNPEENSLQQHLPYKLKEKGFDLLMAIRKGSSTLSVICLKIISSLLKNHFSKQWYNLTMFQQNVPIFESLFESILNINS